jgi:BlaI family penicillinase repressor
MHHFWQQGDCSPPQIHKLICQDKQSAYTTVKTIIDRLEEKGALKREAVSGRSIIYSALVTPEDISKSLLPNFVKRFFSGKSSQLIAQMLKNDELSDDDIAYLESYIKDRKSNNGK